MLPAAREAAAATAGQITTSPRSSGTSSKNNINIGNVNQHSFEKSASDKKINVMAQTSSSGTQVTVTFEEK